MVVIWASGAVSITLEEAAAGVTKTISYGTRLSTCDDCNAGLGRGGKIEDCPHGTGTVIQVQYSSLVKCSLRLFTQSRQGTRKKD